jgi:aminomethyltransferase
MENKKTALNSLHKKYGAKLVSFAGYEMPIQYSDGIIEEHKNTRKNAGIFDVSHMGQLFIKGDETLAKNLEKIFPTELSNAKLNQSKYSFLMNEEAGIHDDLIITKVEGGFNIVLNAACKHTDLKLLSSLLDNKYEMILSEELSLIAIQGPKAVKILEKIINGVSNLKFMNGGAFKYLDENIYITRSGYTGEDGFEISIKNKNTEIFVEKLINEGAKLIGLGARDTLRLEAGLCLYGHDMDISKSPVEANLKWAISKNRIREGGFIGFEKIKSQIEKGVSKVRVGIKPEGRIIAREKTSIFSKDDKNIGEITSGTFGPSVQAPVAMGYVENSFSKIDTKVFLEVRGKKYPANISNLPFYKKSYVKGMSK